MKEFLALRMEKKEKVWDFDQRFASHFNNSSAAIMPAEETLIEYYSSALSPEIAMFMKQSVKPSLLETYEEAKNVEEELKRINKQSTDSDTKTFNKKPLLLTKPKEECLNELDNVVKMVQKISNKIVDLEKDKEAGSSRKPFRQFFKKKE